MKTITKSLFYCIVFAMLVGCAPASEKNDDYSVVWRYKIKPESRAVFEKEYGHDGSWYTLFAKSREYRGSFLHKSDEDDSVYLLIDTWTSQDSYNSFKEQYKDQYEKFSSQFESLYVTEEKIGSFNLVR